MSYEIYTTRTVEKAIARLPGDGYRIRVGEWRALYRVNDRERRVDVVRVAHRRDVYRS